MCFQLSLPSAPESAGRSALCHSTSVVKAKLRPRLEVVVLVLSSRQLLSATVLRRSPNKHQHSHFESAELEDDESSVFLNDLCCRATAGASEISSVSQVLRCRNEAAQFGRHLAATLIAAPLDLCLRQRGVQAVVARRSVLHLTFKDCRLPLQQPT